MEEVAVLGGEYLFLRIDSAIINTYVILASILLYVLLFCSTGRWITICCCALVAVGLCI